MKVPENSLNVSFTVSSYSSSEISYPAGAATSFMIYLLVMEDSSFGISADGNLSVAFPSAPVNETLTSFPFSS